MTIEINGSGTITGLTAGGLPDGSIATDDIANNAVTAGKLATTLDLSGKTVTLANGSVTAGQLATTLDLTGKTVTLPSGTGGKILQVVQGTKTDTSSFSVTGQGQFNDVLTTNITPVAASSDILVMWYTSVGTAVIGQRGTCRVLRDTTAIGIADSAGSRILGSHGSQSVSDAINRTVHYSQNYLDTPTYTLTDTLSYKLQVCHEQSAGTVYINREGTDSDANTHFRGATYMILMEVAG